MNSRHKKPRGAFSGSDGTARSRQARPHCGTACTPTMANSAALPPAASSTGSVRLSACCHTHTANARTRVPSPAARMALSGFGSVGGFLMFFPPFVPSAGQQHE